MSKDGEGRKEEGRRQQGGGGDRQSWIVCFVVGPAPRVARLALLSLERLRRGIRKVGRTAARNCSPGTKVIFCSAVSFLCSESLSTPKNHVPFHPFCSFIHSVYSVAASSFSPPFRRPFEFQLSLSNVPLPPPPVPFPQCAPRSIPSTDALWGSLGALGPSLCLFVNLPILYKSFPYA